MYFIDMINCDHVYIHVIEIVSGHTDPPHVVYILMLPFHHIANGLYVITPHRTAGLL